MAIADKKNTVEPRRYDYLEILIRTEKCSSL